MIKYGRTKLAEPVQQRTQKGGEGLTNFFSHNQVFLVYIIQQHASQELGSKGGVLSQELPAYIYSGQLYCPKISTHVHPVTFIYIPRLPLYLNYVILTCSASVSNVFILNTHSYAYVAFLITTSFSILYSGLCLLHNTRDKKKVLILI